MADKTIESNSGLMTQILNYGRMVFKWKWTALTFFIVAVSAAVLYSYLTMQIYTASGSVWIENEANILPFADIQPGNAGTNLPSQARLLQSRSLAADVIEKLKLYENPEFVPKSSNGVAAPNTSDLIFRQRLIENFLKSISVTPIWGTQLVDVKFSHPSPKLATEILNALFDGYISMIVKKKYSVSEQASEFLKSQIAILQSEIAEREKKLNDVGSEKNILPLTPTETPTVNRLAEVSKALTDVTIDRINKLNHYNQIKSAPLGEIPDNQANAVIQSLRTQYSTLSREYAKRLLTVRPEYPEMQRLKSELDSATDALQAETQKFTRSAYADYEAITQKEQSLQKMLDDLKTEAYKTNSNSVLYNTMRIELANRKTLLDALSKRQSETAVSSKLQGLDAMNVWIVDKANYPLSPSFPNKRKIILLGLLIGLAGGLGLAFGLEYLNQTIKTSNDIAASTGLPMLGVIPSFNPAPRAKGPISELRNLFNIIKGGSGEKIKRKKSALYDGDFPEVVTSKPSLDTADEKHQQTIFELIASRNPSSIQSECYRSIRTTLHVSAPRGKLKTLLFTSPLPQEGKSSTVSNLGISLAEANTRVVIVDSDLRKPKQSRIFGLHNGPGLTRFLISDFDPTDLVMTTQIPNLYLINSGPSPANPLELLMSEKMGDLVVFLKRSYDYILFDTPPILAVSDAIALGPIADAIILVGRGGHTPIRAMKQAKQKLDAHKLKCLGVILNDIDLIEQDGYYARRYHPYYKIE